MRARWGDRQESVSTGVELRALVARVRAAGRPEIVILETDAGRWFSFGVGHLETVLAFSEVSGASWHSAGDVAREDRLRFWSQGQLDDFLGEMAVPESLGLAAAEWFVEHGTRALEVRWEADWEG